MLLGLAAGTPPGAAPTTSHSQLDQSADDKCGYSVRPIQISYGTIRKDLPAVRPTGAI
jgi:hypothetical protein